jgi:SNF2 family DNA or RNA helicase
LFLACGYTGDSVEPRQGFEILSNLVRLCRPSDCRPAVIDGDVSGSDRRHIFSRFQSATDSLRVCLIQPQAAAHGVTLTAADTVVFWGPVSSVETYVQCCARADRVGQNAESVTVFHLQASDVEKRMYKKLKENIFRHDLITDLYEEILS